VGYFLNIRTAIVTSLAGLGLSWKYLLQARKKRNQDIMSADFFKTSEGTTTLQYPHETIPVPDNGRYKLHNEIDDCIVCDKCAKVCPVNCIEIVPIRSLDTFGETSDGSPKRIYAETFNIDMGKCMFCGLCTTVCPTECLTMTSQYDYSTFDIRDHLFQFGNMTDAEIVDKKQAWEAHQLQKADATTVTDAPKQTPPSVSSGGVKPVFKPRPMPVKPAAGSEPHAEETPKPKPVFKPRVMPPKPKSDE
jgi:NADH-quinone oxidoreductase subunit I